MKKLKPWVKNVMAIGVTTVIITIGVTKVLPNALDQMHYEQYEKPAQYAKEVEQERLDSILKDNIIDFNEQKEYEELTRKTSK